MEKLEASLLKNLYPLNQLPPEAVDEIRPSIRLRWFMRGSQIFDIGAYPDEYCYVLEGSAWLSDHKEASMQAVVPAMEREALPLPYVLPSIHRASAATDVKVLMVDRVQLSALLSKYPSRGAGDWMSRARAATTQTDDAWQLAMMQSSGFQRVIADNMRRAFGLMTPVSFRAGDVVIEQGTPANHFYVIAEGRCEILRSFAVGRAAERIAECGIGETIGEDALLSGNLRNATVRMLTDGRLMRLSGDDFRFLIKRNMSRAINLDQARVLIDRGAKWFDIRMPSERMEQPLKDAITIPYPAARMLPFKGDPYQTYIVACGKGGDAPAIAFALCKQGYDAYFLKDGIAALRGARPQQESLTATGSFGFAA
jgi:rhodanese-related sulfurtransferase